MSFGCKNERIYRRVNNIGSPCNGITTSTSVISTSIEQVTQSTVVRRGQLDSDCLSL